MVVEQGKMDTFHQVKLQYRNTCVLKKERKKEKKIQISLIFSLSIVSNKKKKKKLLKYINQQQNVLK